MATIRIPPVLRASVDGEKEVSASGANVGDVLNDLAANHPATHDQLFAADGRPEHGWDANRRHRAGTLVVGARR